MAHPLALIIEDDHKTADIFANVLQLAEMVQAEADLVLLKPVRPGQLRDLAFRLRPLDLTQGY
jgi:hypothetical protein